MPRHTLRIVRVASLTSVVLALAACASGAATSPATTTDAARPAGTASSAAPPSSAKPATSPSAGTKAVFHATTDAPERTSLLGGALPPFVHTADCKTTAADNKHKYELCQQWVLSPGSFTGPGVLSASFATSMLSGTLYAHKDAFHKELVQPSDDWGADPYALTTGEMSYDAYGGWEFDSSDPVDTLSSGGDDGVMYGYKTDTGNAWVTCGTASATSKTSTLAGTSTSGYYECDILSNDGEKQDGYWLGNVTYAVMTAPLTIAVINRSGQTMTIEPGVALSNVAQSAAASSSATAVQSRSTTDSEPTSCSSTGVYCIGGYRLVRNGNSISMGLKVTFPDGGSSTSGNHEMTLAVSATLPTGGANVTAASLGPITPTISCADAPTPGIPGGTAPAAASCATPAANINYGGWDSWTKHAWVAFVITSND